MKKTLPLFIIGLMLILNSANAQMGTWKYQNPSPGANGQNGLCVVSADTVYIGCWNGLVAKTLNGGTTWINCTRPSTYQINFLTFLNGNVGYTNGAEGELYKTSNGGLNWTLQTLPNADWDVNKMVFVNNNIAYIGGTDVSNDSSFIAKTTNGGLTWVNLNIKKAKRVVQIQTFGLDTVYAFHYAPDGDGTSFSYSHNGGSTWSNLKNMPNVGSGNYSQGSMYFLNKNEGYLYCTAPDTILKTIDGGVSWTNGGKPTLSIGTDIYPNTVHYFNQSNAVVFGSFIADPIVTSDGGGTWTNSIHSANTTWIYSMIFAKNSQVGYANGNNGEIVKTINGGVNWVSVQNGFKMEQLGVHFIDNQTGFTCGEMGSIYKTTNGGNNFTAQNSGVLSDLKSIQKIKNTTIIFTCGNAGKILKSIDDGASWISQTTGVTDNLNGINFINKDTGIVVGTNGKILRTLNGGSTWNVITTNFTSKLNRVKIKGNNVYVVSDTLPNAQGVFYKSSDLGQTFTAINIPAMPQNFNGISFVNDSVGFIAGTFGTILKTINRGQSWIAQLVDSQDDFSGIDFADASKGLGVCKYGSTLETSDGGSTWQSNPSELAVILNDVSYPDVNNGWAVGETGTVAKYTNNYIVTSINEIRTNELNVEIYPNPSTDYIYFKTAHTFKTIELYDNLGRLIETSKYNSLQNNYLLPSGLTTGIYFIKLKGESNEVTKKIIIKNN